ncbi:MAG: HNH endonuclease [Planctomycetota bacterium]|nr:HNH endonuclease [Planctomycetota bacterium]
MNLLEKLVLVLNRNWLAVNIATARRAIVLLYSGRALAIGTEDFSTYDFDGWVKYSATADGDCISSPRMKLRIPEVIVLSRYSGWAFENKGPTRASLLARDGCTCQYCGRRLPPSRLTIDHIIPRSRGGSDDWDNLVVACIDCNIRKGDFSPEEAHMTLIKRPRRPLPLPYNRIRGLSSMPSSWLKFLSG